MLGALCKQLFRRKLFWLVLLVLALVAAAAAWHHYHWMAAQTQFARDHYPEAQAHLDCCLWLWRRDPEAALLGARIARFQGKHQEAADWLAQARQLSATASEPWQLEWVLLRVHRGELSDKETGLEACVAAGHPQSALILKSLTAAAMQELRYHAAKGFLERWEKIEPLNPTLHEWRGSIFNRLNNRDGAMEAFRKCLELDPDRIQARLHLVELLLETVQPREVAQHLDHLRQKSADDSELLLIEARYRDMIGESETARVLTDRLLDQKPDQMQANLLRANLELKENRPTAAEVFVRRSLAARPYDYVANYTLLRCLTLQDKSDEVAAQTAKVNAIQSDHKRLQHLIANEREQSADKTAVMYEIGATLFRIGEDERALDWLYRTLELDPDHQATHRLLVDYYEKLADRDKADQHRQRLKS